MKTITVIIAALLMAACTDSNRQSFQVVQPQDATLNAKTETVLPKLLKACPGLNRYAGDFSPASVNESQMRGYEGGVEFVFKVATRPQQLPPPLNIRSADNNCYIFVSANGSRAYIGKSACASICNGSWLENDPGLAGSAFEL